MINLHRTDSEHPDFVRLVEQLDAYLTITDGEEHAFYDQYNGIEELRYVILAYENDKAIGCGAMKAYDKNTIEVKRMYTLPDQRGKGVASRILNALEVWGAELGFRKCILETGKRQVEAVSFYPKNGYQVIANFGQYAGRDNSICFQKRL